MKELGLFGGTFNPIHLGHLLIAECAREQFSLDKLLFVTGARLPHRSDVDLSMEDRFGMVAAAVESNPYFEASRLELDRPGPSYTVDTLKAAKELYGPSVRLNLIVGGDNVPHLRDWHRAEELFELCRILVAPRTQESPGILLNPADYGLKTATMEYIDFPPVSISSSLIRSRRLAGKSVRYMVPSAVNAIIMGNGHYGT